MTPMRNFNRIALCLILFFTAFTITLTNATTEDNYKNDNNFLTNISESTHTENGYKTNIIINPNVVGIYANENGYKLDLAINTHGIGGSHSENGYKLDIIPEKTFPDIPDVAVTKITTKTVVGQGYTTQINATISNQALNYESFHIIIQANTTTIKTQTITLTGGNSTIITFTWNTTGVAKGNYTVTAEATPVPGETDATDNTYTDGWIIVAMPGDITGPEGIPDGKCDMRDIYLVARGFGAEHVTDPNDPRHCQYWHKTPCGSCPHTPNADTNNDGKIDMRDVYVVARNFGKTDP